ncbi:MAG: CBS domain-containing protein [Geminicoccaceae bacterium]
MLIAQILKAKGSDTITTTADCSVHDAAKLMAEHNIGAVVVLDKAGEIAGIISERDITRALARDGDQIVSHDVGDLMTKDVVTTDRSASVQNLMRRMTEHRIRHLPVVEDNQLLGVISIGDVVKSRMTELESETSMLHDYIAGSA